MKPPIVPNQGRGIDTINFRNVKESESVDISGSRPMPPTPGVQHLVVKGVDGSDNGLRTPGTAGTDQAPTPDPFEEFNSVTLHHDDDPGWQHIRPGFQQAQAASGEP